MGSLQRRFGFGASKSAATSGASDAEPDEKIYRLPLRPMLAFTDSGFEARFSRHYSKSYYRYAQINIANPAAAIAAA